MPCYVFRCTCGIEDERFFPIGTAKRVTRCTCGGTMRLVIGAGVQIAPSALEEKGRDVRLNEAMYKRWDDDMPAYRRMRHQGMQPSTIDGCARLEDKVQDQTDIDLGHLYDGKEVTRERVIEAREELASEGLA